MKTLPAGGASMRVRQVIDNLLKIAVFAACVYAFVKWQGIGPQSSEATDFAERACTDAAGSRYNVSNIKPVSVKSSNDGFVVRASVTTRKGTPAMVICLTNAHGGVTDIMIDSR